MPSSIESMSYRAALQHRADVKREMEQIHAALMTEGREWTKEERKKWNALRTELEALGPRIQQLEMEREAERHMATVPDPNEDPAETRQKEEFRRASSTHQPRAPRRPSQARPGEGRKFADLFGPITSSGKWRDFSEFLATVHSGLADPRLISAAIGNVGIPAEGGFSVPSEHVFGMLDASLENEIVRPRADVQPMTSTSKKVWGFRADSSSSNLYGAFAGQWVAEGAEITIEVPKTRQIELITKKLAVLTETSNELLADGLGYREGLEGVLIKAVGWYLDFAFLRGSGAGQPLGVLNAPSLISIAKETSQVAATIVPENIVKIYSRLHPASQGNAVWVASPSVVPQLFMMNQVVKNVAGTENVGGGPFFIPQGGAAGSPPGTLLGRPILFSEKMSALGTKFDILLADFSQYVIGLRQDMSLDRSSHAGFTRDTSHFRAILRGDGQPKWSNAYTPKNGSSLSWAVTLDTRA